MKKKIAVYTCITGDYDNLKEIDNMEKEIDYYCFTNNKSIKSNTWNVIYIEDDKLDNHMLSRKIKMLGHPIINENYDISVWMDGSIVFQKKISDFVKKYLKKNHFAAFKHHERNCIYDEAIECIRLKKDNKNTIINQMKFLKKEQFPENYGLYEMTVFIKEHNNPTVIETMNLWFDMISKYSKRDQLSFMYCIWKTGLKIDEINLNIFDNEWFKYKMHNDNSYKIYLDYGNGFSENNTIIKKYKLIDKKNRVSVKIPDGVKNIRFDPTSQEFMHGKNIKIYDIDKNKYYFNNILTDNNYLYFINDDPNIVIESNGAIKELTIDIELYKNNDITNKLMINLLDKEIQEKNIRLDELTKENNILKYRINQMYNSKCYKISKTISRIIKKIHLRGENR